VQSQPGRQCMGGVLRKFLRFSKKFMSEGRGQNIQYR
jgi:hypothetical protein